MINNYLDKIEKRSTIRESKVSEDGDKGVELTRHEKLDWLMSPPCEIHNQGKIPSRYRTGKIIKIAVSNNVWLLIGVSGWEGF